MLGFKRGQRGFTMVELMVVMAILAILAAIAFPAVSGKGEAGKDAQTITDASLVNTAVGDYYKDQPGADVFTTDTRDIAVDTPVTDVAQKISVLWPEEVVAAAYDKEFPTTEAGTAAASVVTDVKVYLEGATEVTALDTILEGYNAVDFSKLTTGGYMDAAPNSEDVKTIAGSRAYHTYLWLVKKATSAGGAGTDDSRTVVVFKLTKLVVSESATANGNTDTLTYVQIY